VANSTAATDATTAVRDRARNPSAPNPWRLPRRPNRRSRRRQAARRHVSQKELRLIAAEAGGPWTLYGKQPNEAAARPRNDGYGFTALKGST
jgi:hypothetical protein